MQCLLVWWPLCVPFYRDSWRLLFVGKARLGLYPHYLHPQLNSVWHCKVALQLFDGDTIILATYYYILIIIRQASAPVGRCHINMLAARGGDGRLTIGVDRGLAGFKPGQVLCPVKKMCDRHRGSRVHFFYFSRHQWTIGVASYGAPVSYTHPSPRD